MENVFKQRLVRQTSIACVPLILEQVTPTPCLPADVLACEEGRSTVYGEPVMGYHRSDRSPAKLRIVAWRTAKPTAQSVLVTCQYVRYIGENRVNFMHFRGMDPVLNSKELVLSKQGLLQSLGLRAGLLSCQEIPDVSLNLVA